MRLWVLSGGKGGAEIWEVFVEDDVLSEYN